MMTWLAIWCWAAATEQALLDQGTKVTPVSPPAAVATAASPTAPSSTTDLSPTASTSPAGQPTAGADIQRLLVFPIKPGVITKELAESLSQLATFSIRTALPGVTVLDRTDLDNLLQLAESQQLVGCENGACMAEIAGTLGADHLAVPNVGKAGLRYIIDIRLIRVAQAVTTMHLSDQIEVDEDRLAEAMAQMAHRLVNPTRPLGAGVLEIGGSGQVEVDGTLAGQAPLTWAIPPGEHVITWRREAGGVPVGERRVVVERYVRAKVEPHETVGNLDLSGFFATFGVGTCPNTYSNGVRSGRAGAFRAQIGWAFANGLTVQLSRFLQSVQDFKRGERGDLNMAADIGTLGLGYQTSGRLRLRLGLDLGSGLAYSRSEGFDSEQALAVQTSATGTYSFERYAELGIAVLGNVVAARPFTVWSTSVLLVMGIPAGGVDQYPQRDFYRSPWLWAFATVIAAGGLAIGVLSEELAMLSMEH